MDNNRAAWRELFYTANFSAQYETKTFNLNLRISTLSLSPLMKVYISLNYNLQLNSGGSPCWVWEIIWGSNVCWLEGCTLYSFIFSAKCTDRKPGSRYIVPWSEQTTFVSPCKYQVFSVSPSPTADLLIIPFSSSLIRYQRLGVVPRSYYRN